MPVLCVQNPSKQKNMSATSDVQHIHNPIAPCVYHIPGGMYPGKKIRVEGSTLKNANSFSINLQCGPSINYCDDVAFHLTIHFADNFVSWNCLCSGEWKGEEIGDGEAPLKAGRRFDILILCEQNSMKVTINGRHVCEFKHQLPYQRITHITLVEDIIPTLISFEGAETARRPIP